MIWKEPSIDNLYLSLPELSLSSNVCEASINAQEISNRVPIDKSFLKIWEEGPESVSALNISKAVHLISQPCCELIKKGRNDIQVFEKSSPDDLVTNMDKGIEMIFRIWLNRHLPDHKIIGEEGCKDIVSTSDYVWYIDPVDGTSNFVNGSDNVTLHINCVYQGRPFCSTVGLPFFDKIYTADIDSGFKYPGYEKNGSAPLVIGTEFRDNDLDNHLFTTVLNAFSARPYRIKSIGCAILAILNGEVDVFYKPGIRYWDILAPLSLLYFARPDLEISIIIPKQPHQLIKDAYRSFSPFSNDQHLIDRINKKSQDNGRIGFVFVFPKSKLFLKEEILKYYISLT